MAKKKLGSSALDTAWLSRPLSPFMAFGAPRLADLHMRQISFREQLVHSVLYSLNGAKPYMGCRVPWRLPGSAGLDFLHGVLTAPLGCHACQPRTHLVHKADTACIHQSYAAGHDFSSPARSAQCNTLAYRQSHPLGIPQGGDEIYLEDWGLSRESPKDGWRSDPIADLSYLKRVATAHNMMWEIPEPQQPTT